MGCCSTNKLQFELPLEKMEEYDKIKLEIEQFLSNNDQKDEKNIEKLKDLINKLSNKISKYENDLLKMKRNNGKNDDISNSLIEGINQDILILKDYNIKLNNLIQEYENDNEKGNVNEEEEIIDNNKEKLDNLKCNKENNDIYFKKCIRRNKKRIVNEKNNLNNDDIMNNYENNKKIEIFGTSDNGHSDNNVNIIFELENGKKIGLKAKKEEIFLEVIQRLDKKEIGYDKIENLKFFKEKDNISEKIFNGEKVQDFNLNDFQLIQIRF